MLTLKEEIYNSYKEIKPDDGAKKRMLKNIRASASCGNGKKRRINVMKKSVKLAACIAAATLLMATAVYAGLIGLRNLDAGKEEVLDASKGPVEGQESAEPATITVDMITTGGMAGSPEYEACMEWKKFEDGYDTGELNNDIPNFGEEYEAYAVYTQEMADKLDEICEKYQLSKLTGFMVADDYEDLCEKAKTGDFLGGTSGNVENEYEDAYLYSDGTFNMSGAAVVSGSSACRSDYQFLRNMKGTLDTAMLNVGDIDGYKQWNYTTSSGVEVMLSNNGSTKALIIVEREKSFIMVNLLGDILAKTFDVSDEALEAIADSFDFTALP